MKEIWKDVKDYEGLYQVSSIGRVKSLPREYTDSMGRAVKKKERILSLRISSQTGYPTLNLFKNGKRETVSVHRLVAEAFIPNPQNLPCINHKDETRDNNIVENLEWCSYRYNNTYGSASEKRSASALKYWDTHQREPYYVPAKHVIQYSLKGEAIREFISIGEAERELKVGQSSGISACCNKKLKTTYVFVWRFAGDPFSIEDHKPKRHQKYVIKRDCNGNEIARYKSVSEAARVNKFNRHALLVTNFIDDFFYEVEKKDNEFIPTGHKGPRPDLIGKGARPIYQFTKEGEFIAEHASIKEAAIAIGKVNGTPDIVKCAKGFIPSAFGFNWKYKK